MCRVIINRWPSTQFELGVFTTKYVHTEVLIGCSMNLVPLATGLLEAFSSSISTDSEDNHRDGPLRPAADPPKKGDTDSGSSK